MESPKHIRIFYVVYFWELSVCNILEDGMKVTGIWHIISYQAKEVMHDFFMSFFFQNQNNDIQIIKVEEKAGLI